MPDLNPSSNLNEPVTGPTMKDFNLLLGITIGIAVVVGIGFITLLLQYFSATQVSYEDLKDQILVQNQIMGELQQKFENCNAKKTSGC